MADPIEKARRFTLKLGKHNGKTLQEISKTRIGYIWWLATNFSEGPTRTAVDEFCTYPDIREKIEKYCNGHNEDLPPVLRDEASSGDSEWHCPDVDDGADAGEEDVSF